MMTSVGSNQLDINGKVYNVSQIFYNGTIFNGTSVSSYVPTCPFSKPLAPLIGTRADTPVPSVLPKRAHF